MEQLPQGRLTGLPAPLLPLDLRGARGRWGAALEARLQDAAKAPGLTGEMVRYQLSTGGKRLRALLPVVAAHNLGGRAADAVPLGVALELLHNASLIHDDCQDGDTLRRGAETVWARWGAAQAINAGDAMLFRAVEIASEAPCAAAAVPLISRSMVALTAGQAMDIQLHTPPLLPASLDTYFEMIERKTALLLGLCLRLGALAAEAPSAVCAMADDYGRLLGRMFQVQDDLLDVQAGGKGKSSRGRDIVAQKVTFLTAWTYANAPGEAAAKLEALVTLPPEQTGPREVEAAIALLEQVGALDAARAWLESARARAQAHPMARAVPSLASALLTPRCGSARSRFRGRLVEKERTCCNTTSTSAPSISRGTAGSGAPSSSRGAPLAPR